MTRSRCTLGIAIDRVSVVDGDEEWVYTQTEPGSSWLYRRSELWNAMHGVAVLIHEEAVPERVRLVVQLEMAQS